MEQITQGNPQPRELRFLEGIPQELSLTYVDLPRPLSRKSNEGVPHAAGTPGGQWSAAQLELIRPDGSLTTGHIFEPLIRSTTVLSAEQLQQVKRTVDVAIHLYDSGAIPAASNPASSYSVHSWTRDTVLIALALFASGNRAAALKSLVHLGSFYGDGLQRDRFVGFHFHPDPVWLYRNGDPRRQLPHVRARIEDGRLQESPDEWSHSQLDAIGLWLGATFGIARSMKLNLTGLDTYLTANVNPNNKVDSIYSVALRFLCRIKFWEQSDHGAWEDRFEPSRASSTNACLLALREAHAYFQEHGWTRLTICDAPGQPTLREEMERAIIAAEIALEKRIPRDGSYAIETDRFPSDAALVFLLYPCNIGLSGLQEEAVLRALYRDRMGSVGFSRRDTDEYVGQDYAYNSHHPVFVDPHTPGYRPAEWTLFDPLLAAFYFQRFIDSGGCDGYARTLADAHCKRSLSHVTPREERFWKQCEQREVVVPALRIPEAFWWDSREQRWRPNENSPLLMAEAAFALMLERALVASHIAERNR